MDRSKELRQSGPPDQYREWLEFAADNFSDGMKAVRYIYDVSMGRVAYPPEKIMSDIARVKFERTKAW